MMRCSHEETRTQSPEPNSYTSYDVSSEFEPVASKATLHSITLGNGRDILAGIFSSVLEDLEQELIFVTCFWARSESLALFGKLLRALSGRALSVPTGPKIRVRICFSSLSLTQKLLHTPSRAGRLYKSKYWVRKLGLPPPEELEGLDLQIKSIFIAPFSVWHPKFVIVDRKMCFLPSCNVSWENWFEGCIQMDGPFVGSLVEFWQKFWCFGDQEDWNAEPLAMPDLFHTEYGRVSSPSQQSPSEGRAEAILISTTESSHQSAAHLPLKIVFPINEIHVTILLPSQHHRNPHFRPFPWQSPPRCPKTPLNASLLQAFSQARRSVLIQTPNVTSPPVILALCMALSRGVDVTIVTNERMMRLEQCVTAGTSTVRCLKKIVAAHSRMVRPGEGRSSSNGVELGRSAPGRLRIYYFSRPSSEGASDPAGSPISSHIKLTIVDEHIVFLGSGNMDRASWYTSQELGISIYSRRLAKVLREAVYGVDSVCTSIMYASDLNLIP